MVSMHPVINNIVILGHLFGYWHIIMSRNYFCSLWDPPVAEPVPTLAVKYFFVVYSETPH